MIRGTKPGYGAPDQDKGAVHQLKIRGTKGGYRAPPKVMGG